MLAAAMFLTGPTIWEGAPIPVSPSLIQLAGFGFLVVFGSVICLTSYIKVVRTFTPQTASTFAYVNPVIGVLLGWALLSEQPSPVSLVGMAVILVSIAIILTTPASGRPS
jgi:drug/metabolite transporter (DMT)-like permease